MHIFTVVALGKFKIRVHQGPFLSQFCLFSEIFCLFLQFFTLESCYIWFTLSLEYPSAYVYSFALVKFKTWVYLRVCSSYFEPFCVFSETLCLFLLFSTLESCYIWLVTSLEYPSAYVYSGFPGKIQNQCRSGGIRGM